MYKANLSFAQLHEYIDFLLYHNLIKQNNVQGREIYAITEKGADFLQKHGELILLLKANGI